MLQIQLQAIFNLKLSDLIEILLQTTKYEGNKSMQINKPSSTQEGKCFLFIFLFKFYIFLEFKNMREIWKDGNSWRISKQERPVILKYEKISIKLEMQTKVVEHLILLIWIMIIQKKESSLDKRIMIQM